MAILEVDVYTPSVNLGIIDEFKKGRTIVVDDATPAFGVGWCTDNERARSAVPSHVLSL